jgi:Kdo2-lipid IVA lauroyltransferase/acyltransferase
VAWFVKIFFAFIAKAPMSFQLSLGRALGYLWFDILRIRRRTALDNLARAFPEMPEAERVRIARASCINLGMSFVEFCRFPFVTKDDERLFVVEGREHLATALSQGRGVFLLTQHIGNGDWATVGLALAGIKLLIISKKFGWAWANALWFSMREAFGTQFIEDRNTSLQILKALKKNKSVVYMLDQFLGPPIGVRTKFFGYETGTPAGLATLARRSGSPVVPVYTFRRPDGVTVIHFDPEIQFQESGNPDDTVKDMTQRYCDKIESYVRQFPEQWMWVHRRWKEFRE